MAGLTWTATTSSYCAAVRNGRDRFTWKLDQAAPGEARFVSGAQSRRRNNDGAHA